MVALAQPQIAPSQIIVPSRSLQSVEEEPITRISTCVHDLDLVFGSDSSGALGPVLGSIGLLGGQEGIGKTRLYTAFGMLMALSGYRVGVAQLEMNASQYKTLLVKLCKTSGWTDYAIEAALQNFFVYGDRDHGELCNAIDRDRLQMLVIDSFPMLRNQKSQVGIENIVFDLKEASRARCNVLMIAHLNQKGQIKGNGHIRYLVDATFYGVREPHLGPGAVSVGVRKNRFGPSDVKSYFNKDRESMTLLDKRRCERLEYLSTNKPVDF